MIFYAFKLILDASLEMTPPNKMIWLPSYFPSIFVSGVPTYNFTCAFVPGIYTILALESIESLKSLKLCLAFIILNIWSCLYMLTAHINWTCDLSSGIITGGFSFYSGQWLAYNFVDPILESKHMEWGENKEE